MGTAIFILQYSIENSLFWRPYKTFKLECEFVIDQHSGNMLCPKYFTTIIHAWSKKITDYKKDQIKYDVASTSS